MNTMLSFLMNGEHCIQETKQDFLETSFNSLRKNAITYGNTYACIWSINYNGISDI